MRIGIDISQLAYPGTGVATFVANLVDSLLQQDLTNQYVLFYSSLRKKCPISNLGSKNHRPLVDNNHVTLKTFTFPPTFLDFLWNRLHIFPIEWLIGPVDVFISSDWVQPPSKAKKITILYDVIIYKYPEETHNQWKFSLKNLLISPNIVTAQKRKLYWVKKEVDKILCISQATKKDAMQILHIPESKLEVVYPGI